MICSLIQEQLLTLETTEVLLGRRAHVSRTHETGSQPDEVLPAKGKANSAGKTAYLCC